MERKRAKWTQTSTPGLLVPQEGIVGVDFAVCSTLTPQNIDFGCAFWHRISMRCNEDIVEKTRARRHSFVVKHDRQDQGFSTKASYPFVAQNPQIYRYSCTRVGHHLSRALLDLFLATFVPVCDTSRRQTKTVGNQPCMLQIHS